MAAQPQALTAVPNVFPVAERCDFCGWLQRPIRVHGHLQCGHCRTNIEPCCEGETQEIAHETR